MWGPAPTVRHFTECPGHSVWRLPETSQGEWIMSQCVLMMGTFDSKGNEFAYLYDELLRRKVTVKTMNVGVFEPKGGFPIDSHVSRLIMEKS